MKNQPVLYLPKSVAEHSLNAAAWLFTALHFVLAWNCFPDLPEQIPTHFNVAGEADKFGSKNTVFLVPVLSLFLVAGLAWLVRFPHKFNYPNKITPENAAFEYRKMRLVLLLVNALTSLMFMLITWNILQGATGGPARLGIWFWMVFIMLEIAPLAILFGWNRPKPQNTNL